MGKKMRVLKKASEKAQRFLEAHKDQFMKEFNEGARYAESYSKAAEDYFGLPDFPSQSGKKKKKLYDEMLE